MIGTYISAALICAASLLVGRSLLAALGHRSWSWLEPSVGLAAIFAVAGFFARAPSHATAAGSVSASTAPQESQNLAPSRFSFPQLLQTIAH